MNEKLIEIRIPKALLVLTEEEFARAVKRGKAIKRRRTFEKRQIARGTSRLS